jgi:DNA-binding XRE family transcriptional regulator
MPVRFLREEDLAPFAKRCRLRSGLTKAEVAIKLGVSRVSVQQAEENPEKYLASLRIRIIETCSDVKLDGPVYRVVNGR